jgi:general secretion pathway protein I
LKLSHGAKSTIDRSTAGFTIIEALVALAVVAITLGAIGSLVASNTRGARKLEHHVAMVQAANDVLALDLPARKTAVGSVLSGQTMDHEWRMEIQPLAELMVDRGAATPSDVSWIPATVRIQVRSPSGATIGVQTVRLFEAGPAK